MNTLPKTKVQPLYIVNGKFFHKYEAVVEYAESLGLRVTNTENIRGSKNNFPKRVLITLDK